MIYFLTIKVHLVQRFKYQWFNAFYTPDIRLCAICESNSLIYLYIIIGTTENSVLFFTEFKMYYFIAIF